LSGAA